MTARLHTFAHPSLDDGVAFIFVPVGDGVVRIDQIESYRRSLDSYSKVGTLYVRTIGGGEYWEEGTTVDEFDTRLRDLVIRAHRAASGQETLT